MYRHLVTYIPFHRLISVRQYYPIGREVDAHTDRGDYRDKKPDVQVQCKIVYRS